MIRFLDIDMNRASGDVIAAGRCDACGETFTTPIERKVLVSSAPDTRVLMALERAHRCQTRGAA